MRVHALLLLMIFIMTACATQQAAPTNVPPLPTETATVEETATPLPTAAPRSTLPPTWTPESDAFTATPEPSNTPVPTPTPNPQSAPISAPVSEDTCTNFGPDLDRTPRTYRAGTDITVYWTPVEGAAYYYIALTDETATVVREDYVAETTYVFTADLFESGKLYGWEAFPINAAGIQMCTARGAELFPDF